MHSKYILLGNIKEKQKYLIPLKSEIILPSVSDYPQYQCVIREIQLAVDFLCNISYMTKALKATNKFATTYIVKLENTSSVQAHAKKKSQGSHNNIKLMTLQRSTEIPNKSTSQTR